MNVDDRPQAPDVPASSDSPSNPDGAASAAAAGYAEIAEQAKRIVWPCCILGVIAVAVASVLHYPLAGVGICIGLALGMVNARLLQQSVLRRFQAATGQTVKGSAFLFSGLTRLAAITGTAVVLAIVNRPLGIGVVIGLAVYQVVLLGVSAAVMYRQVRA